MCREGITGSFYVLNSQAKGLWQVIFMDVVWWESIHGCLADFSLVMSAILPVELSSLALVIAILAVMLFNFHAMFHKLLSEFG